MMACEEQAAHLEDLPRADILRRILHTGLLQALDRIPHRDISRYNRSKRPDDNLEAHLLGLFRSPRRCRPKLYHIQ